MPVCVEGKAREPMTSVELGGFYAHGSWSRCGCVIWVGDRENGVRMWAMSCWAFCVVGCGGA